MNISSQIINSIISAIIGFITVPLAISYWDLERYSIWTIITSLIIYFGITGLGIDCAAALLMTKHPSKSLKKIIFKKGLRLLIISSLIGLILFIILIVLFPDWYLFIGKISGQFKYEAKISAIIFLMFFLINIPFGLVSNSFSSYSKAYINYIFNSIQTIILLINLLITISFKFNLIQYSMLYSFTVTFLNIIKTLYFISIINKYDIEDENDFKNGINDTKYKEIISFGLRLTIYGIAVLIYPNATSLIISNNIGLKEVAIFSVLYKLFYISFTFLYSYNNSLVPIYGKEFGYNNWDWIIKNHSRSFNITTSLGSLIIIGAFFFFKDIIYIWTNSKIIIDYYTLFFLGLWFFFNGLSNFNLSFINSFNYTKGLPIITWLDVIIFIFLSLILIKFFNITGVAIGMCAGSLLSSCWGMPYIVYIRSNKKLKYNFIFLTKALLMIFLYYIISIVINNLIGNMLLRFFTSFLIYLSFILILYLNFPDKDYLINELKIIAKKILKK